MPEGIWCQPVGPGPATPAPLFIDSNCAFPQYLGEYGFRAEFKDKSANMVVSNFDGQGELVIVPATALGHSQYVGTSSIPSVLGVKGMGISGQNVHFDLQAASYSNLFWDAAFHAYKIWPRANQSYGITFSNSVNFFSLNDGGVVGQCIWAYQGAVPDNFRIPAIPGFDPARYIVFMWWDQGDTVVTYTPRDQTIHVTYNRMNKNGGQTIANAKVIVFCDGASVPEHNGGLNIYAPNGQTCVFSTYRTPFMIRGFVSTAGGNPGVNQPAVCLSSTGLIFGDGGGWQYQHWRGMTNQGGVIGTGFGPEFAEWTNKYNLGINSVISMALPVLSATDYIA